jgi:DNA-directed RNA polymerase specialized sigma24 family protein
VASPTEQTILDALAGDRRALRIFVDALSPVIQARVVRGLRRRRTWAGNRDVRQEVEDMTQDVFSALFAHGGRVLRAWEPTRGLSLENFVGLIADRQVASILRSGRKSPWTDTPTDLDAVERASEPVPDAEQEVDSRQALVLLLDRMREALSPRGLELFQRLYVDEESIDAVSAEMKMSREAIYSWRNRVGRLLRQFAEELSSEAPFDPSVAPRSPEEDANHVRTQTGKVADEL